MVTQEERAARHFASALAALGLDTDPESARSGPRMAELFGRFRPREPRPVSTFALPDAGPVVLRGVAFYSLCAHHFVPFFGHAEIAYQPAGVVAGLGSLHEAVQAWASRPQLQERLTEQIADHLHEALNPRGLAIRLSARQMCVELRGGSPGSTLHTTAERGAVSVMELLD